MDVVTLVFGAVSLFAFMNAEEPGGREAGWAFAVLTGMLLLRG